MKQLKNKIKCMLSYSIYNGELHFYYLAAFHEVIALFLFTVAKRSIFPYEYSKPFKTNKIKAVIKLGHMKHSRALAL